MQLPQSDISATSVMNRVFDNTEATYKFCWFLSLLDIHVKNGHILPIDEIKDNRENETKDETKELSERQILILKLIKDDETIIREEMTQKTGVSVATIKREVAELQAKEILNRVGGRKNGRWQTFSAVSD